MFDEYCWGGRSKSSVSPLFSTGRGSSVVEQPIRNRQVASSTLALGSTISREYGQLTRARLSVAGVEQPIVPELSPFDFAAPSRTRRIRRSPCPKAARTTAEVLARRGRPVCGSFATRFVAGDFLQQTPPGKKVGYLYAILTFLF